jgi:predicted metal-dependent enzyme (double-stranded beta helix superfamily)
MDTAYNLEQYVGDLRRITAPETDPVRITNLVAPLAKRLAQAPAWLHPEYRECDAEQGFSVHLLHEGPNHDLAVFLISWLPKRGTTPHNHKTWVVVVGIEGREQEINYERVDDGTIAGYADLRRGSERVVPRLGC